MSDLGFLNAWEAAVKACPADCVLVLERIPRESSVAVAAIYRRRNDEGTHNAFFASGATETEALAGLLARLIGEAVAA